MGLPKRFFDLILSLWPLYKVGLWMGRQPGIGTLISPVFSQKIHQVTMIPVHEAIAQGEQIVLPYLLLDELVEQASARFVMQECVCRKHEGCQSHPINLGCLFLGDGAVQIHSSQGRLVDVPEAKHHIRRGMAEGLYPLIAHTVIDSLTLGISYKRMLTVCFCCECCCAVQHSLRKGPAALSNVIQRLPGLDVCVDEGCTECGDCVTSCPAGAISMDHGKAEISQACKGCGICVNTCNLGAIKIEMMGKEVILEEFRDRMQHYADIGVK